MPTSTYTIKLPHKVDQSGETSELDDINEAFVVIFGDDINIDWRDEVTVEITMSAIIGRRYSEPEEH